MGEELRKVVFPKVVIGVDREARRPEEKPE